MEIGDSLLISKRWGYGIQGRTLNPENHLPFGALWLMKCKPLPLQEASTSLPCPWAPPPRPQNSVSPSMSLGSSGLVVTQGSFRKRRQRKSFPGWLPSHSGEIQFSELPSLNSGNIAKPRSDHLLPLSQSRNDSFFSSFFFKLMYSYCTVFYKLQVCKTVIHNF